MAIWRRENIHQHVNGTAPTTVQDDFKKIPGSPIVYWLSKDEIKVFDENPLLSELATLKHGMSTSDNNRFMRQWYEVSISSVCFSAETAEQAIESNRKWFPFCKGGTFKRWYGNHDYVVNWFNNGIEIKDETNRKYPYLNGNLGFVIGAEEYYFREALTWSSISSALPCFRYLPKGFVICNKGQTLYPNTGIEQHYLLGWLNSEISAHLLSVLSPTLGYELGYVKQIPVNIGADLDVSIVGRLIEIAKLDWDSTELSWNFRCIPLVRDREGSIKDAWLSCVEIIKGSVNEVIFLEEQLNDQVKRSIGVPGKTKYIAKEVTLERNPCYAYGIDELDHSAFEMARDGAARELISYATGCMMGRYSLDREGLVYAHSDNDGFDIHVTEGDYKTFPADEDGIIPLTDQEWFKDDATNRFREFVKVVWGEENLQENLDFVAESLCLNAIKPKKSEPAMETIRRYLSTQFYKDHLKTYKKRPIYWLFSSGKQKAFECLVYLHRYNEGTLSRMRTEYVTPLLGKYSAYIDQLKQQVENATSTVEANRLKKEQDALIKKQVELREFDDKLKHYADMRISLDLDDGVKVNYSKFGDLLSDMKAITGSDSGAE